MNWQTLVWKEIRERPTALLSSALAIFLGVAALVAIRHITAASEGEVARQMSSLGANVLILPKDATLQNYYAADLQDHTLPESHVTSVLLAGFPGVERLSPKLCAAAKIGSHDVTLTGILPQSEFRSKAAWQSVKLFGRKHTGCKRACVPKTDNSAPEALATQRTIDQLQENELVIGADVAERTKLELGQKVQLFDETFQVLAVLPRTGTIDDSRVFAHLHTVQRLAHTGEVVSAIEVLACCEDAAGQLLDQLAELLPDAKIVTVSHVVEAQVGVNRQMGRLSWAVVGILVIVGGASVAGTTAANVRERRREIGTLLALGATPGAIARLFLLKALWLGLAAGIGGAVLGLVVAVLAGSQWAQTAVPPLPGITVAATAAAIAVCLVAAYWPARQAAHLDPCLCFQEV